MPDAPETLFHYTTAHGLLGILKSSVLWASDLRFLNDVQEGLYAKELLLTALTEVPNPANHPKHPLHRHGQAALQTFADYHGRLIQQLRASTFGVFVACFCTSGDLLSQWRAYGSDHGYAIEFTVDALEAAVADRPIRVGGGLFQVQYGEEAAQLMVDRAVDAAADFNLNHPGVKAWHKAVELTAMLATVKDPAFEEECEWRLIATIDPYNDKTRKISLDESNVKFRPTDVSIFPYIELPISLDDVVSIRVGPGQEADVRQVGVEALLKAIGSEARVVRSAVPLR